MSKAAFSKTLAAALSASGINGCRQLGETIKCSEAPASRWLNAKDPQKPSLVQLDKILGHLTQEWALKVLHAYFAGTEHLVPFLQQPPPPEVDDIEAEIKAILKRLAQQSTVTEECKTFLTFMGRIAFRPTSTCPKERDAAPRIRTLFLTLLRWMQKAPGVTEKELDHMAGLERQLLAQRAAAKGERD